MEKDSIATSDIFKSFSDVLFLLGVGKARSLEFTSNLEVQPGRFGGIVGTSFFDVYRIRNAPYVVGFGKHQKVLDVYPDDIQFAQSGQKEYELLLRTYAEVLPHLIPKQHILYANDLRGEPTTVFLRELVDVKKTLPQIHLWDFKRYPQLAEELRLFADLSSQHYVLPDITNPNNLVLDAEGRVRLLDLIYLVGFPTTTETRRQDVVQRVALRNLRTIRQMARLKKGYSSCYRIEQNRDRQAMRW